MAKRILRSPRWQVALMKRTRMRDHAKRHLLEEGFCGLTLNHLAADQGCGRGKWNHYHSLDAVLVDVVRDHQAAIAERMTEAVLASRALEGPKRVEALTSALLDALDAERDGHRAATMILAGMPTVADPTRNHDCWLHGVFAEAIGGAKDERAVLARSLLTLIENWAPRLEDADADSRAMCARLVTRMVTTGVPLTPR